MNEKEKVEAVVRAVTRSFYGADSTLYWTSETMRQTDVLEKRGGAWKIVHEHTSAAQGWDGKIDE